MEKIEINTPADAGFALLLAHREGVKPLNKRAAQYAGQLVANPDPLTEAQARWLNQLCEAAGIDAAFEGGAK